MLHLCKKISLDTFELYFKLGVGHISDLDAFDHILFIIALCVIYEWKDWKRLIVLVTAFTIGHSITLFLATLGMIKFESNLIEFLIPLTIIITAANNIRRPKPPQRGLNINYLFALFFGFIHGMGFSNFLKAMLGKEESIFQPLLAFNIGIEVGQLFIVVIFFILSTMVYIFDVSRRDLTIVVSSVILGMSFMLLLEAKYW